MPWFQNLIPDYIKKSVCTCLIKRYLSHFIENEITRDQLNLDLLNGRGTVEKIQLAVESLNELGETQNWPIEFVDGYIDKIHLDVPWISILSEATYVEIQGLKITVQPKQRKEDATSMFESMWNSMTSSMQLAEEYAKEEAAKSQAAPAYEGVELFAQTIESIVGRVKIKFIDSIIQIEHVPRGSLRGVGLIINIDLMEYFDESNDDPPLKETTNMPNAENKKAYVIQAFTTKKIQIEGVKLSSIEFLTQSRTFSRSVIESSSNSEKDSRDSSKEEEFFEADVDSDDKSELEETIKVQEEKTPEEVDNNGRHAILIAKICGRQQVRIKIKQSENLAGPKVAIELNFGSVILFLSPRQFHVLLELVDGFSSPDMEDTSNVAPKSKLSSRPMNQFDYQKVEQELQNMVNPLLHGAGLQGAQGWSSDPMDESLDTSFLPMRNLQSGMYDSTMSGFSGSMESSMSSSVTSNVTEQSKLRRRASNIDMDPTADISKFQIHLAGLALVLLHEDLISVHSSNEQILVAQMQNMAKNFFEKIGNNLIFGLSNKDFDSLKVNFERACNMNHLRLLAAPVQMEADEKTTLSSFSISGQLSAAHLQFFECLYGQSEVKYVPLLKFDESEQRNDGTIAPKPNLRLRFRHLQRTGKPSGRFKNKVPKTEIAVSLNKCAMELDISLVDRLSALINQPPICQKEATSDIRWAQSATTLVADPIRSKESSEFDLKVCSPTIDIRVRFPIPDFKPPHDLSKVPWWERNVRQDYLSLILYDASFQTEFKLNQEFDEYRFSARGLDIFYFESENSPGIHIGKSDMEESCAFSSINQSIIRSSVSIKMFPKKPASEEYEPEVNPMMHSCYGAFENQAKSDPGPFGTKRVVHESDTPHSKLHEGRNDSEELIIPGDKPELDKFIKSTVSSALILVEIFIPTLSVQLKSKHIYELIYNRINNDLLLWVPNAPKPNVIDTSTSNFGKTLDGNDAFMVCKSAIQYAESESESDNDSESGVFYSTYDRTRSRRISRTNMVQKSSGQSEFVMNLSVGQGLVNLYPLVRDATTNNVIPEQHGEFDLNVEDANIFVVSGYKGDTNLSFVCVQLHSARLNHCDIKLLAKIMPPIKSVGSKTCDYLKPTIYKSDPGALPDNKNRGGKREMLTVAIKIQASHETHHVKTIQVSMGLNKATLRYTKCPEPNSWISQLIDFFVVNDYPIAGYKAKEVLTELNLHLWDCAVDYRPLHLPLRALVTVGNFSLSSHLTAASHTSTLRFIFEECGLFLSDCGTGRKGTVGNAFVDLRRDYVNVIEMSLFEISLKTADKKSGLLPQLHFRASNHLLNIRTCSDSGRALMQLIVYFASDGDLTPNDEEKNKESQESPIKKSQTDASLIQVENQETVNLSKSQHEQVCEMLHEAMEDNDKKEEVDEKNYLYAPTGAKIFFFPDEKDKDFIIKPLPQVTTDLGDITYQYSRNKDSDDDFCFVENEPGALYPKYGKPEITWHTMDTVRIVDNHFSVPIAKKNLLEPPPDYPTSVSKYTLCEMSVLWQMYGGNDFKLPEKVETVKKEVKFADSQLNEAVAFSKSEKHVVIKNKEDKKREAIHWIKRGGVNRNHSVLMELQLNKVRFQYDVYPENTTQASRQVLLISDVEIRDRLESSQINKFLYQYTSQSRPKKAHSHMVVIKALNIRPDVRLKTQECCLKVSLLPIRLNIDQESLLFLIHFFKELSGEDIAVNTEESGSSLQNTPVHQLPVMTINEDNAEEVKQVSQKAVNDNLILLMEESRFISEQEDMCESSSSKSADDAPTYFRKIVFSPEVLIRLDYQGRRVDLSYGPLVGLLMGLGQLNCSELRLKRVVHKHGILGTEKLLFFLLQEWLDDIKRNQLSTILGGVGPMHALLQLFQGVRDLFWLPIEQYQRDGRIVRGIQRGANSFTTSTAMAALELTTKLIYLIQITAETAYDMLSPGPSIRMKRIQKAKTKKKKYNQPQDIREGLTNAVTVVKEGIGEAMDSLVRIAVQEKERKGYTGAVGGILRQIPPTLFKPAIIATEAGGNVLGGIHSQLAPDARKEANEKWGTEET